MNAATLGPIFGSALDYDSYLATDAERGPKWRAIGEQTGLTEDQLRLVEGFSRTVRVLVVSGIWCGDCVQQGPLIQHIADANDHVDLRWVDRDAVPELADAIMINAGKRVPVAIFMAEDFEPVSVFGDRTLTRYRAMAQRQLGEGASCPIPGAAAPADELAATLQDWLDEFERVHLLLRLSGRLRQRHGD